MTMLVLLSFILITYFGYLVSLLIIKDLRLLERMGLPYIIGLGLITLFIFFYSLAGIKITYTSILILLLTVIPLFQLVNALLKRKITIKLPNVLKIFREFKWYEKSICVAIGFMPLFSFIITLYYPVSVWDALSLYDFRAKVITETGYFSLLATQSYYYVLYPLLTSLTHSIVYLSGGSNPQFTYSLYLLSFAAIFFSIIRRNSNRIVALFSTLLLVTNPVVLEHSTISYTNLPYTVFYVIGIIYLHFSVTKDRLNYLFMSSLLIGLSTWARSFETFWLTGILVVLIYSIYKKSIYPLLVYLPAFFIIQQPWKMYQSYLYGSYVSTGGQLTFVANVISSRIDFQRIVEASLFISKNTILTWGPILPLFLVVVFFEIKNSLNKSRVILLSIILFNFLMLFGGAYLYSLYYAEWKIIPDSARRMAMFFVPLMIYYIGTSETFSKVINIFKIKIEKINNNGK